MMPAQLSVLRAVFGAALCSAALLACPARGETGLGPTLQRIADSGTIFVGHREAAIPFSYVILGRGDDYVFGYTWDICRRVVEAVGERIGRPVEAVPVSLSANNRIMMVKTGIVDLECGATTNNVSRQKQVSFSVAYYIAQVKVMVRRDSGIRTVADLANRRVVTTAGATADRLVKQAALVNNVAIDYIVGRTHAESMAMMMRREADAYVADDAVLVAQRAGSQTPEEFVFLDGSLSVEPYGIMLRKDDAPFKRLIDETLVDMMRSGEMARLYDKWFMAPIPPAGTALNLPMSGLLRDALASPSDKPVN